MLGSGRRLVAVLSRSVSGNGATQKSGINEENREKIEEGKK